MALHDGKKVAVAIAGLDINTPRWHEIVWGDPAHGVYGRAPRTMTVAINLDAELVIFNTAGSRTPEGELESEATHRYSVEHLSEVFPEGSPEYTRAEELLDNAYIDRESVDTLTKAQVAVRECVARDIDILIFVSDKTHSTRMIRDLNTARADHTLEVAVWSADTEYGVPSFLGESAINTSDPHFTLPEHLELPRLLRRIFDTPKNSARNFLWR